MRRATGPTRSATRSFISPAALLVKVMARMANGDTPRSPIKWAMRRVSTRVLPEPAPATTSNGPVGWVTASSWSGFSPGASVVGGADSESGSEKAIERTLPVPDDGLPRADQVRRQPPNCPGNLS